MKINKYLPLALVALFTVPLAIHATTIDVDFSYTDGSGLVTGDATLTASLIAPGEYEATAGSITISAASPADSYIEGTYGLITNPNSPNASYSPSGLFIYDDLVFPGAAPIVTYPGLLGFGPLPDGGAEINFFSEGPNTYDLYTGADGGYPYAYQFTVPDGTATATVEVPDGGMTIALLGTAFAGVALLRRRRMVA